MSTTQPKKDDFLQKLDTAMQVLIVCWEDHHASAVADAMDMLSAYREEYVRDNGQFGVGA